MGDFYILFSKPYGKEFDEMSKRIKYINPEGAAPAQGLYSHVTKVDNCSLYFIAGQLSVDQDGSIVGEGDFEAQFYQVFHNLQQVISGLGASFNDVVKFNTFLVHSQHIGLFKKLREEYFPKIFEGPLYPPNTLIVVDRLVKEEFLLEVEAIVAANEG